MSDCASLFDSHKISQKFSAWNLTIGDFYNTPRDDLTKFFNSTYTHVPILGPKTIDDL